MRFLKDIRYSLVSLSSAKMRTFLTMLGVLIGVMSVLAVSSIGLSAQKLVVGQVQSLGSNLIGVIPGGSEESGPPPIAFGIILTTLDRGDERALADIAHVEAAASYVRGSGTVAYRDVSAVTSIVGVSDALPQVEDFDMASGRFFGPRETANFARVAVLGHSVAEKLAPDTDLVGTPITIKGTSYQVIGVMEKRGSAFFQDQDDQVLIPVTTSQKLVEGIDYVNFIRLKVDEERFIDQVKDEIDRTLQRRHGIRGGDKKDFTIRSTDQAISVLGNVTGAMNAFLVAVTAVSLLVGGINIMNIMFVAVRERTREIGLRKALGAKRARILAQFLIESALIAVIGGVIGVVTGIAMTYGIARIIVQLGYAWEFTVSVTALWVSLLLSAGVGIVFGMVPAVKAARLDPLTSLHYE